MANNKNKIKELVSEDEDPTAELEALFIEDDSDLESDENTFDFGGDQDDTDNVAVAQLRKDLRQRSETIGRLQFDIEQLRSRWLGLEAEINSREEITRNLQKELEAHQDKVAHKKKLIKKRDDRIKALKTEIRERDEQQRELLENASSLETTISEHAALLDELRATLAERDSAVEDLQGKNESLRAELAGFSREEIDSAQALLSSQAGQIAADADQIRDLQRKLANSEQYADSIRQQLSDMLSSTEDISKMRLKLQTTVESANQRIEELTELLEKSSGRVADLTEQLAVRDAEHDEEIRVLRFELGEAQDTVTSSETLNQQLAADLLDTRSYKEDLERMLEDHDEQSQSRIDELEREVERLTAETSELQKKLDGKSEAVACLLEEMARKSEQMESIGQIENVIHDIDDRMSESIDFSSPVPRDRVTRLLVGEVDGQLLRFPLFKDRLTIGRTGSNDIQLKAQYVSRRHAVVLTEGDITRVIDWGSKNGVYVNSKRITEHFLKNGDVVTIGTAEFRYEELSKKD